MFPYFVGLTSPSLVPNSLLDPSTKIALEALYVALLSITAEGSVGA